MELKKGVQKPLAEAKCQVLGFYLSSNIVAEMQITAVSWLFFCFFNDQWVNFLMTHRLSQQLLCSKDIGSVFCIRDGITMQHFTFYIINSKSPRAVVIVDDQRLKTRNASEI